jgi:hypothetical protein
LGPAPASSKQAVSASSTKLIHQVLPACASGLSFVSGTHGRAFALSIWWFQ